MPLDEIVWLCMVKLWLHSLNLFCTWRIAYHTKLNGRQKPILLKPFKQPDLRISHLSRHRSQPGYRQATHPLASNQKPVTRRSEDFQSGDCRPVCQAVISAANSSSDHASLEAVAQHDINNSSPEWLSGVWLYVALASLCSHSYPQWSQ